MAKLISELGADVIDDTIVAKKTRFTPKQKNYIIGLPILGVIVIALATVYTLAINVWLKDFENMAYITYTHSAPNAEGKIEYATINRVDPNSNYPAEFRVPQTVTVDGKTIKITHIDDGAFSGCTRLTKVILPSNIEHIGTKAFAGCTALKEISFSKNLSYIGNDAFMDTAYKASWPDDDYVRVNNILLHVGSNALGEKTALVSTKESSNVNTLISQGYSVFALDSLTQLGGQSTATEEVNITQWMEGLFSDIDSIEYVELPDYLTEIPANSFADCKNLEKVIINENTQILGENTFNGCSNLEVVEAVNSDLTTIGNYAFKETALTSLELPETVVNFGNGVFQEVDTLVSFDYPKSVTTVPAETFDGCSSLNELNFYDESLITAIGEAAFRKTAFTTFTVPQNVTKVSDYTFAKCENLEKVYLYDTGALNRIDAYAFDGSTSFKAIHLLDNEGKVLDKCLDEETVYLPSTVTSLSATTTASKGGYQFRNTKIKTVEVNASLGSIGDYAFANSTLESIKFHNDAILRTIGQYVFADCVNLDTTVIFPDTVNSIGIYAFKNCTSLKEVHLPDRDKGDYSTIQRYLFSGCTSLESVNVPSSVTKISENAFENCVSLKQIRIPKSVQTVEDDAFIGCDDIVIFIEGSEIPRKWEDDWNNGVNHYALNSVSSLETEDFIYNVVMDGEEKVLQVLKYVGSDTDVVIPSEEMGYRVVAILNNAFINHTEITSVSIPSSVTVIEGTPFIGCTSLTTITIDQAEALEGFEEGFNKTSKDQEATVTYIG